MAKYTNLNKVLAKRGLYLKARKYYTSFEVLPIKAVDNEIRRYKAIATYTKEAEATLEQGKRNYRSKWSTLGPRETQQVARYVKVSL